MTRKINQVNEVIPGVKVMGKPLPTSAELENIVKKALELRTAIETTLWDSGLEVEHGEELDDMQTDINSIIYNLGPMLGSARLYELGDRC